ncbi:hypothetical protein F5888DRAFT_1690459 [Russula emetica]|nr:hypothetical protein F5888DRAFT_1690459 [Russula emetica]
MYASPLSTFLHTDLLLWVASYSACTPVTLQLENDARLLTTPWASWRVRLSHCFIDALLTEVAGLSCFPFGPGLRAYGAGLSRGF